MRARSSRARPSRSTPSTACCCTAGYPSFLTSDDEDELLLSSSDPILASGPLGGLGPSSSASNAGIFGRAWNTVFKVRPGATPTARQGAHADHGPLAWVCRGMAHEPHAVGWGTNRPALPARPPRAAQRTPAIESTRVNHQFTSEERNRLNNVESIDYLAPNSGTYRKWLYKQPHRRDWDRWMMMGMIGICTGLAAHMLYSVRAALTPSLPAD